jgi:predicted DCC family thiol-disulfide oxidoreductase YuxK
MLNLKQLPVMICIATTMMSTAFSAVAEAKPPFANGRDDIPSEVRDRIRDEARNNRYDRNGRNSDIPSEVRDRIRDEARNNRYNRYDRYDRNNDIPSEIRDRILR